MALSRLSLCWFHCLLRRGYILYDWWHIRRIWNVLRRFRSALMVVWPRASTQVTKLIPTATSHMVTSLIFLNYKFAFLTSSKVKISLQKFCTIIITNTSMFNEHAFWTVLNTTNNTYDRFLIQVHITLTMLVRAKTFIFSLPANLMEDKNLVVFLTLL